MKACGSTETQTKPKELDNGPVRACNAKQAIHRYDVLARVSFSCLLCFAFYMNWIERSRPWGPSTRACMCVCVCLLPSHHINKITAPRTGRLFRVDVDRENVSGVNAMIQPVHQRRSRGRRPTPGPLGTIEGSRHRGDVPRLVRILYMMRWLHCRQRMGSLFLITFWAPQSVGGTRVDGVWSWLVIDSYT